MNAIMRELVLQSVEKEAIHVDALPTLDLYIDQVITLIEQGYASNKRTPDEKLLTKMMVNNYSKAGLVRPIKGKKYSRAHIVQMLIIYALKSTLSIGEIKQVLDALYSVPDFDGTALFSCYENALSLQERAASELKTFFDASEILEADNPSEYFASLMSVCAMSDALSELAGRMVSQYFATPEQAKNEKNPNTHK